MIVARPLLDGELCLLTGREHEHLNIRALCGRRIALVVPPSGGWTQSSLEQAVQVHAGDDAWEALLGAQWIGSSEV